MAREQMIDRAVRVSMARVTMRSADFNARFAEGLMVNGRPFTSEMQALHNNGDEEGFWAMKKAIDPAARWFNRSWLDTTPSRYALERFPRRVQAIRKEFARLANDS